jgi:pimeloyl-ACP methyl ester carboxylesterase
LTAFFVVLGMHRSPTPAMGCKTGCSSSGSSFTFVPTFVLIPGAGTAPEVYGATIDELRALGHEALAPPLPLDDPEAHPSDHASAVASAVPARGDVVVVAQSLGAFAGPLVADQVDAALLVLLAPMVPAPGESAGQWWDNTRHTEAIADLLERHGPMSEWSQQAIEEVFLHDVPPDVARDAARFNGAPGRGMFTEPWPHENWPDIPTRVLAPRDDRLFPWDFQRRVVSDRLGLEIDEIAGGHLPMLSRPAALAERLVELWSER